jgi:two-component system LytT family response regulator
MKLEKNQASSKRLRAILVDDEPLARLYLNKLLMKHPEIDIVGEAGDLTSAVTLIRSTEPDVIFLDIQMQGRSSFSLLPKLDLLDPQPSVVFVTAYDKYAIRAFEANALDYLTKPVSPDRMTKTIQRLKTGMPSVPKEKSEVIGELGLDDFLLLRDGSKAMMVKTVEITAIESDGDYTRILLDKESPLLMKRPLSHWEKLLPQKLFYKVSRRLLVNTQKVSKVTKRDTSTWELHLENIKTPILLSNLESKRLMATLSL